MAKLGTGAIHNRQPKPHPDRGRGGHTQTVKFLKHRLVFDLGNAGAGVPDLKPHPPRPFAPHPDQNPSDVGITDRVRHQVLHDPAQIGRVAFDDLIRLHHP